VPFLSLLRGGEKPVSRRAENDREKGWASRDLVGFAGEEASRNAAQLNEKRNGDGSLCSMDPFRPGTKKTHFALQKCGRDGEGCGPSIYGSAKKKGKARPMKQPFPEVQYKAVVAGSKRRPSAEKTEKKGNKNYRASRSQSKGLRKRLGRP